MLLVELGAGLCSAQRKCHIRWNQSLYGKQEWRNRGRPSCFKARTEVNKNKILVIEQQDQETSGHRMCPDFFTLKRLDILEHILEGGGIIII